MKLFLLVCRTSTTLESALYLDIDMWKPSFASQVG